MMPISAKYKSDLQTLENCVDSGQFDRPMMEELFTIADEMAKVKPGSKDSLMLQGYLTIESYSCILHLLVALVPRNSVLPQCVATAIRNAILELRRTDVVCFCMLHLRFGIAFRHCVLRLCVAIAICKAVYYCALQQYIAFESCTCVLQSGFPCACTT